MHVVDPGAKDRGGLRGHPIMPSWQAGDHTLLSWPMSTTVFEFFFLFIVLYHKERHFCSLFIHLLNLLFFTPLVTVAMLGTDKKKSHNTVTVIINVSAKTQSSLLFGILWYCLSVSLMNKPVPSQRNSIFETFVFFTEPQILKICWNKTYIHLLERYFFLTIVAN